MIKFLVVLASVVVFSGCSKPDPVETEAVTLYQKAFDLEHSATAEGRAEAARIYYVLQMPKYAGTSVVPKAQERYKAASARAVADVTQKHYEDTSKASEQQARDAALNDAIRERR